MPHTYEPPDQRTLRWVEQQVAAGARVAGVERLPGGITADMDRIALEVQGARREVVLRRWPEDEEGADLVRREAAALAAVEGRVPAPRLLAVDQDASATGRWCTLTTALPGQPDLAPADRRAWVDQLAVTQAAIHAVPVADRAARPAGSPGTDRYGRRERALDWISDRALRDAAREAAAGPLLDEHVLVHGDYQHFNVLWVDGSLTGVVDWPSAGPGRRGSDVGHCRLNLAVLLDARTAADYLAAYERTAGVRVDRVADLRALLCFDHDWREFIPRQVAGRAPLDPAGMADRVATTVRAALDGLV